MLTQHQLAAYFEGQIAANELVEFESRLADDPAAQCTLADQQNIHLALEVLLGSAQAHERVKQSIFMVLRGATTEQLIVQVMAETRGKQAVSSLRPGRPLGQRLKSWFTGSRSAPPAESRTASETANRPSPWLRPAMAYVSAAAVLAIGLFLSQRSVTPSLVQIGEFTAVDGEPTVQHPRARAAVAVQRSTPVHLGDRIETGDADKVEVRFHDGTTLRLGFNTVVRLPENRGQRATPNAQRATPNAQFSRPSEVRLFAGQIWTKVQTRTNAPEYAIRTDLATAVARGTEFGVKLQRSSLGAQIPNEASEGGGRRAEGGNQESERSGERLTSNVQRSTSNPEPSTLFALLTVKEGAVDFFNAHGSVRATAMTESTATADSAPTEPRRWETLQVVTLADGTEWSLMSRPLDGPEAAEKLVGGGGWVGVELRDVPEDSAALTTAPAGPRPAQVRVGQVWPGTPAAQAGFQVGDVVLTLEGRAVSRASEVERDLLLRPGGSLMLRVGRGEQEETLTVQSLRRTGELATPGLDLASAQSLDALSRRWLETPWATPVTADEERRRQTEAEAVGADAELRAAALNHLGVLHELEDALGPAIRAYGRAVALAPDRALYRFNLALALRKIGSFERAHEELTLAARLAPEVVAIRKHLVGIESLLGDEDRALVTSEALVTSAPADHGAWELRAQLLFKAGNLAEAAEAARRAIALDDACPVAWSYLAETLQQAEQWAAAEETWLAALERAPYEATFHLNLGALYHDQDRWAEAEQRYRRAIELRPNFALAWSNLGDLLRQAPAPAESGSARAPGQRDLPAAIAALEQAATLGPTNVETRFSLGNLHYQLRRWESSADWYRRALELDPHSAVLHNNLGDALRLLGRLDEAEVQFRRALELDPGYGSPRGNLAILLAMSGRHAEAEAIFRGLVAREADAPPARRIPMLVNLAIACSKQGKLDEAEGWFREALPLAPADPQLASAFAEFLAEHRRHLDEALALATRAVEANPNDPDFLSTLGWVQAQRGELDAAEQILENALTAAGPGNPDPEIADRRRQVRERKMSANKTIENQD
ncbi:MAG: tetratricopeptide repeat protein [Verrucomicrobiales bacterium]|nr:tetratricopeptide repeat protein [Verrucomicrobiales bacterium]